jgi:hypothetical protein
MSLEGTTLDGAYLLGQCLGADERKITFKARVKSGSPGAAIVKLYRPQPDTPTAAEEQIAVWEAIKKLEHPNLLAILGAGRTKLGHEELIYVAVEAADETLDKVLRERPLDAVEAGELVVSICHGLEHLHAAGFVHGSISPEEVFGVGDSIKLSTDGVRRAGAPSGLGVRGAKYRAPESVNGNITAETDVWCFGATLFEAMTQKNCGADCRSDAAKLTAPFGSIVHRCLYNNPDARCTLPEIVQLYERRPRAFTAAAGAGADLAFQDSRDADSLNVMPAPIQGEPAEALPLGHGQTETHGFVPGSVSTAVARTQRRTWAILAISLLVVAALIWQARPRKSAQPGSVASSAVNTPPKQQAATPAQKPAVPAQVPPAPKAAGAISSARTHDGPRAPSTGQPTQYVNGPIWRVVIYTYDAAADAQMRAQAINGKHPDLKAEVFSPNGNAGPYLVAIGGQMSRNDAVALRQRALRLGMPRDTYVQNYKQ